MSWNDESTQFHVVKNHEEQHSIWPDYKEIPGGWEKEGKHGSKAECLEHINTVWTDMRPKSLRDFLDKQSGNERAVTQEAG